jgi:hypothetical protein
LQQRGREIDPFEVAKAQFLENHQTIPPATKESDDPEMPGLLNDPQTLKAFPELTPLFFGGLEALIG